MNIKNNIFLILFVLSCLLGHSQAPESMNYQAVIRNGSGELVTSQQVGLRIKILQGSATGSSVYEETYSPTTNAYGLVNLQLGTGTVQNGTFSSIDWGNGPYFVETAADISGGTSYVTLSTTQFMSVPYALYAKNAGLDSAAVQAMIDATVGSGGGGSGGKSFAFPEGLNGTPITYAISSGNYTVPTGKRLYILNLQGGTSHTLNINGFAINYYATNNTTDKTLGLPIILSAGDVLSGTDAVFNGFLVNSNANLSTVTHRLLGNSNYTVPAGKILYILNVNGGTSHNLYIDGTRVNHYLTNNTSGKTLNLPIIASAGNVITGADGVFNGYVVDENFFDSSSSGSSGSGSSNRYVGELYGGGVVFHVDETGQHGLIVSLNDLSTSAQWGLRGTDVSNCESTTDGASNTAAIVAAGCLSTDAAGLCDAYSAGGFTDWYLPAIFELTLIESCLFQINSTLSQNNGTEILLAIPYASSTEGGIDHNYPEIDYHLLHTMFTDNHMQLKSQSNNYVRAIRAF